MLILAGALALAACSSPSTPTERAEPRAEFPSPTASPSFATGSDAVVEVVDRVLPAVVNVVSEGSGGQGEGTGFIVRSDGVIVTNYHVVERATSVTVLTSEEEPREFPARVIGGDIQADVAVLDVEAEGLPTVALGSSSDLELGQRVVAIGYALGLEGGPSVTSGIVSSLTRGPLTVSDPNCEVCEGGQRVYTDVIQTDAAINPGNSGGPLVDLAGQVVGINSAGTTVAENIGFAIQIDTVKPTVFQAADNPDEPVAFMGVGSADATDPQVRFSLEPPLDEGAVIVNVVPDGPADRAGFRVGDVVATFDGTPIGSAQDLGEAIRSKDPGDQVDVVVVRGSGGRVTLTLTLGVNPVPVG